MKCSLGLFVIATLVAAGCGDPDQKPAVLLDARTDAAPDAAAGPFDPSPGPVEGTWRAYDPSSTTFKNTLTLGTGGVYKLERSDTTFNGSWEILPDGRLRTVSSSGFEEIGSYYVSANRLITGAFVASGPVTGVVGTWGAHDKFGGSDTVRTMVTRGDLSLSLVFTGDTQLDTAGTYEVSGTRFIISLPSGQQFYLVALPGYTIGQILYERVGP